VFIRRDCLLCAFFLLRQRGMSAASGDSDRKVNSGEEGRNDIFRQVLSLFKYFPEENDTDLETDRLLGQQRTDDQGFYDEKVNFVWD
jgi:hypothetical protein